MNKMTDNEAFMCKVIFVLSCMFGGTLAWGLKEHNEKKRQTKYACELKNIYDVDCRMLEGCIKVLGDIADKAVMNKANDNSEDVNDADKSK